MGLVDDDQVPPGFFQGDPVLFVVLQGVDRDDRLVELVERILVERDMGPDLLDLGAVQLDERDREARPEFLLELGQHRLGRDDEDALGPAPQDEFRGEQARLQGLAEADVVAEENSHPRRPQRQPNGIELEVQVVDGRLSGDLRGGSGRRGLAERRLQVQ